MSNISTFLCFHWHGTTFIDEPLPGAAPSWSVVKIYPCHIGKESPTDRTKVRWHKSNGLIRCNTERQGCERSLCCHFTICSFLHRITSSSQWEVPIHRKTTMLFVDRTRPTDCLATCSQIHSHYGRLTKTVCPRNTNLKETTEQGTPNQLRFALSHWLLSGRRCHVRPLYPPY